MRKVLTIAFVAIILGACASKDDIGTRKNPKYADVEIVEGVVTVSFSRTTPFFFLENIGDESVPVETIAFKYDYDQDAFEYKTDLEDWQYLPEDRNSFEVGVLSIDFGEKDILITYPSGTWQFP